MTAHTPGPWTMAAPNRSLFNIRAGQTSVATVYANIGSPVLNDRAGEGEANARLIAAAPDLLALVQDALIGWEAELVSVPKQQWETQEARVARARAAIAKATGGTDR